jgi:putative tryptophan/tyrosine transport system substrate-binding protein
MNRRAFITLLGTAAVGRPLAAHAQPAMPTRRVGLFLYHKEEDSIAQAYVAAFQTQLAALGWISGNNVQFDIRWTGGNADLIVKYAAELAALKPDVVLVAGGSHVGKLQQVTRTVPIVFVEVADAVGGGFVESLSRPGGNATGFTNYEYDFGGKWLELLKQIAPRMTRAAFLRDATNPSGAGQFGVIQALAPSLGVDVSPVNSRDAGEVERGIGEFASKPNGGLIVAPNSFAIVHREMIIALADRYKLPAIYPFRYFVSGGGLISYGPDAVDQYRRAAGYVDRILKGGKPADLPVEQSTKVALAINLKTARALDIEVPSTLLARADEVIE